MHSSTLSAVEEATHDLSAKPLAWCLCALLGPRQLLVTLIIIVVDIQMEWSCITPSCLTQELMIVHIKLASLKAQDEVVKDKAATNEHEGPFLVFCGRDLDAKLTKCLKSTFEQPYRVLGTYSNLHSWLVGSSCQTAHMHTFDR